MMRCCKVALHHNNQTATDWMSEKKHTAKITHSSGLEESLMAGNAIEKTHNNPNAMHSQKPMQITHNNPSHPPKHPDGEQSGNFIEKHDHKKESVEIQGKVELSQAEIPGNQSHINGHNQEVILTHPQQILAQQHSIIHSVTNASHQDAIDDNSHGLHNDANRPIPLEDKQQLESNLHVQTHNNQPHVQNHNSHSQLTIQPHNANSVKQIQHKQQYSQLHHNPPLQNKETKDHQQINQLHEGDLTVTAELQESKSKENKGQSANKYASEYANHPINTGIQKLCRIVQSIKLDEPAKSFDGQVQFGDGKGKTHLKWCLSINQVKPVEDNFSLVLEFKTKKASQLKAAIESDLKVMHSAQKEKGEGLLRQCSIEFTATEKALTVSLKSAIIRELMSPLVAEIANLNPTSQVLLVEGELVARNSIRDDEQQLNTSRKFVKWLAQGFFIRVHVSTFKTAMQLWMDYFSQYIPLLKITKGGSMNIRLKEPEQVDKFMQRLGIDQLIEETPTLRSAIVDLLSIFLDLVSGEADFLRRIVGNALISSTTPSDKGMINATVQISGLTLSVSAAWQGIATAKQIFESAITHK